MPDEIRVLAFSGCFGCGFNEVSFEKHLSLKLRFIGYDQDAIDLAPSHPGNGEAASVDRHSTELPPLADAEATSKKGERFPAYERWDHGLPLRPFAGPGEIFLM